MDADAINSLLKEIPADQHEAARRAIARAELAGIEDFDFWRWLPGKLTWKDIAGVDPKGNVRFLED